MSELRPDKSTAVSPEAHAAYRGGTDAPAKASDAPALNLSAAQNAALATPAELADRYRVIRKLGSGTQGVVFLAERLSDHTKVAIKQLCIDSVKTWKEYTLFHREAEVLEGLDILGVVKLYEACDYLDATPPCSYIVQEYIEGVTLKQALASGYRFSLDRAYALLLQLIDILEKLHTHEPPVIHRDIKPSNLILKNLETDQFQVFLIDFGAVANPKVQSGGSTVAGTFGYMSPEQMIGRATPQSDTYALAALFAYIISGVDPAEMKTQDLRLIIDPYVENHPVALVQTLRRMFEPDLENRLADLGELRRRFLSFKQGHYVLENENFQHFSKQDLITRLNAVKYLCQPQNLEIWQDLPDNPKNREAFPIRLQTHPRFYGYPVRHIQYNPYYEGGNSSADDYGLLFIILYLITGLAGLACLIKTSSALLAIGLIVICAIVMKIIMSIIKSLKERGNATEIIKRPNGRLPWILAENESDVTNCPKHAAIYKSGRKTIATIVYIEFISSKNINQLRVEYPPTFRIYYKFNPPDDDEIDDLIHYADTHRDPNGLFKVGDPLPILYIAKKYKGSMLHVTQSMPYPFPLEDLENKEDYLGFNHDYWTA